MPSMQRASEPTRMTRCIVPLRGVGAGVGVGVVPRESVMATTATMMATTSATAATSAGLAVTQAQRGAGVGPWGWGRWGRGAE